MQPLSNHLPKYPAGDYRLKTTDEFAQLCQAEYTLQHNAMVDEYRQRKQHLQQRSQQQVHEYNFLHRVTQLNTLALQQQANPALVLELEQQLAALNYNSILQSFTLQHWRNTFGERLLLPLISEILNYFLYQFTVKENLTDLQITQLAGKLLAQQPQLRVMELVFVLNRALHGQYGPTWQRIGIDTVLEWLAKYYEASALHLEQTRLNTKPEDTRGATPWLTVEKQLKEYEDQQRRKKAITEKVWQHQHRAQQIANYKQQLLGSPGAE